MIISKTAHRIYFSVLYFNFSLFIFLLMKPLLEVASGNLVIQIPIQVVCHPFLDRGHTNVVLAPPNFLTFPCPCSFASLRLCTRLNDVVSFVRTFARYWCISQKEQNIFFISCLSLLTIVEAIKSREKHYWVVWKYVGTYQSQIFLESNKKRYVHR